MVKKILVILALFVILAQSAFAQSAVAPVYFEAVIKNVSGREKVTATFTSGKLAGKTMEFKTATLPPPIAKSLKAGDKVLVSATASPGGKTAYFIADYVRKRELLYLFLLFLGLVLIVTRWQGLLSFVGMVFSFAIIMNFIIPQMFEGANPVGVALMGGLAILPFTFYFGHGISKKTTIALAGTFIALILTATLAYFFTELTKLTGYSAEEATFLQQLKGVAAIDIKNLLIAGIIIGALGILDDITISQTSIVERLAVANPKYRFKDLFTHAMHVGKDHIASLVNTLILVYAGASLPLFLLFSGQGVSIASTINNELIATEIVRTLVSSIGIVAAVPITTLIAASFYRK